MLTGMRKTIAIYARWDLAATNALRYTPLSRHQGRDEAAGRDGSSWRGVEQPGSSSGS